MKQIGCKPTSEITDKDLEGFCFCTDVYCGGRPCISLVGFCTDRWARMEELLRDVDDDCTDLEGDLII